MEKEAYERGMATRRKVMGEAHIAKRGKSPDRFTAQHQEIMTSIGVEYWYNDIFSARLGYFNESKNKGNRKYMTLGLGFRKKAFGIDVAYLVPVNQRESPLAETLRFTLLFQIPDKDSERKESVTD